MEAEPESNINFLERCYISNIQPGMSAYSSHKSQKQYLHSEGCIGTIGRCEMEKSTAVSFRPL